MRTVAPQAWQDFSGAVTFGIGTPPRGVNSRIFEEGMELARISSSPECDHDVRSTVELARHYRTEWIP